MILRNIEIARPGTFILFSRRGSNNGEVSLNQKRKEKEKESSASQGGGAA
jgi:hypothetical protein